MMLPCDLALLKHPPAKHTLPKEYPASDQSKPLSTSGAFSCLLAFLGRAFNQAVEKA